MTRAAPCTSCCMSVLRRMSPSRTLSPSYLHESGNRGSSPPARICGSKPLNWPQPPVLPVVDKERGHGHEANDRYCHTGCSWVDEGRSCHSTATDAIAGGGA